MASAWCIKEITVDPESNEVTLRFAGPCVQDDPAHFRNAVVNEIAQRPSEAGADFATLMQARLGQLPVFAELRPAAQRVYDAGRSLWVATQAATRLAAQKEKLLAYRSEGEVATLLSDDSSVRAAEEVLSVRRQEFEDAKERVRQEARVMADYLAKAAGNKIARDEKAERDTLLHVCMNHVPSLVILATLRDRQAANREALKAQAAALVDEIAPVKEFGS